MSLGVMLLIGLYVYAYACMCAYISCTWVFTEAGGGQWITWNWSWRQLWLPKWVQGIVGNQTGSSGRAASASMCQLSSPGLACGCEWQTCMRLQKSIVHLPSALDDAKTFPSFHKFQPIYRIAVHQCWVGSFSFPCAWMGIISQWIGICRVDWNCAWQSLSLNRPSPLSTSPRWKTSSSHGRN